MPLRYKRALNFLNCINTIKLNISKLREILISYLDAPHCHSEQHFGLIEYILHKLSSSKNLQCLLSIKVFERKDIIIRSDQYNLLQHSPHL